MENNLTPQTQSFAILSAEAARAATPARTPNALCSLACMRRLMNVASTKVCNLL